MGDVRALVIVELRAVTLPQSGTALSNVMVLLLSLTVSVHLSVRPQTVTGKALLHQLLFC